MMHGKENIVSLFFENAAKFPHKAALVYGSETLSYAQLEDRVLQAASALGLKGIKAGDKVLVLVPMSAELYYTVLALFYLGATAVFLDEWVGFKRLSECCETVPCEAFIGSWKLRLLSRFFPGLKNIPLKLSPHTKGISKHARMADVSANDSALITFTTGSTGKPKAAIRTHRILAEQFFALRSILQPMPDEIDMPSLPIVLLINLAAGCTSVIPEYKASKPKKMDPAKIWRQIAQQKVSRITASPYFILRIADWLLEQHKAASQINKIFTGGAAVFSSDAGIIRKAFPQAEIKIIYGSTEAEPISAVTADELLLRSGSQRELLYAGNPYTSTELRIIRIIDAPIGHKDIAAFEALGLPAGEVGEIVVSGPHILDSYFNSDEAFRRNKIIADGKVWHRTGDAGCIDAEGNLKLAGRCSQIIQYQGSTIYPFLFENFCKTIQGVALGTILGTGDKPVVCIQPKAGADKNAIKLALEEYGTPHTLLFLDKIPLDKRHFSKIDYRKLREMTGME